MRTKHLFILIHIRNKDEVGTMRLVSPTVNIFTDRSKVVLLLWIILLFMFHVCHAVLSVHCRLVVTCLEMTNHLAFLYVILSCVFVTFPCSVLDQVRNLIVSTHDLCLLPYFDFCLIIVSKASAILNARQTSAP